MTSHQHIITVYIPKVGQDTQFISHAKRAGTILAIRSFICGYIYCNRVILWLRAYQIPNPSFSLHFFNLPLQLSELPVKIFGSVYTAYISIAYIGPTLRVLENVLRFVSYFCTWCQWNLDNLRFKVHGWRRHPGYLLKIRED